MKKARKVPVAFASEAEERAYWERKDSTADLDWRRAKRARLPNLQPSTTAISLRLRHPSDRDGEVDRRGRRSLDAPRFKV
jgi:CopG antitoxin of type II toxin-antitoxin system